MKKPAIIIRTFESPAPKCLRSSTGIVHDNNLCVCLKMKGTLNELVGGFSFLTPRLGMFFRSLTVVLQDGAMRDRINCLIDSISDPFSTEIRYHHKCWLKYIGQYQKMSVDLLCMM